MNRRALLKGSIALGAALAVQPAPAFSPSKFIILSQSFIDPASLLTGSNGFYFKPHDRTKLWQDDAGATPVTAPGEPVGKITSQAPSAIIGTQVTAGAFPTYSGNGLTLDGGDYLDTDLRAAAEMTLVARFQGVGGVLQWVMGCQDASTGRCHIGITAAGLPGGAWGGQNSSIIKGFGNFAGQPFTVGIRGNAAVVELWCNSKLHYQGPPSGTPTLTKDFFVGCVNQNGGASAFVTGFMSAAFAVQRFDVPMEKLMRSVGR